MKIRYRRSLLNSHPTLFDWAEKQQCRTRVPWQYARIAHRCRLSQRHAQLVCELLRIGHDV